MNYTFRRQLHREWILTYQDPRQLVYADLFFLMILMFFPLTMSADTTTLRMVAPGLIWIDLLFAFFFIVRAIIPTGLRRRYH